MAGREAQFHPSLVFVRLENEKLVVHDLAAQFLEA